MTVTFQKAFVFSVAEPWGTECNLVRQNEYSIHMEVRTLYARRMFREKVWKIHLSGAGSAGARKVCFEDLSKDIFLEVQNEKCS